MQFVYDTNGNPFALRYTPDGGTTWSTYYYMLNAQGDVVAVTSGSLLSIVASYTYDAWGRLVTSSGWMANINPLRYHGYYYDTETGFYYLQSRYYDPIVKRFINADEVTNFGANGEFVSYNLFAYCLNNPVNSIDPSGTWTIGISLGANLNLCFGVSVSIGVFFDDKGNIDWQWSYAVPGVNKTASLGLLDAGVGLTVQCTNRDTVYDLYGPATYLGVSGGPSWYVGADLISFSKPNEMDACIDGFQFVAGVGVGLDAHIVVTDTNPVRSRANSTLSGLAALRPNQVVLIS